DPDILPTSRRLVVLSDAQPLARAAALRTLAGQASDPEVRAAVLGATRDASAFVRRAALELLLEAPPELDAIEPLFADPDATVREAAVRVAGRLATAGAIGAVLDRLADPELLVARSAADQLAAIGSDPIEQAL